MENEANEVSEAPHMLCMCGGWQYVAFFRRRRIVGACHSKEAVALKLGKVKMRKKTVRKKDDGPALPTPHGRSVAPWRYLVEGERDAPARDKLIPGAIGVTRDRISPDGRMMRVH